MAPCRSASTGSRYFSHMELGLQLVAGASKRSTTEIPVVQEERVSGSYIPTNYVPPRLKRNIRDQRGKLLRRYRQVKSFAAGTKRKLRGHPPGPTFVCAGMMRSGTTLLYRLLCQHPEIFMTARKELHFWDTRKLSKIEKYHAHFSGADNFTVRGEITPSYAFYPHVAKRLAEYNPDLKIVLILRDPVLRAISHVRHRARQRGLKDVDLRAELKADISQQRLIEAEPYEKTSRSYHKRGHYHTQICRLLEFFPREQLFWFRYEDLLRSPDEQLGALQTFLGVTPASLGGEERELRQYSDVDPEIIGYLSNYYRFHNELLAEDFGVPIDDWL